MNYNEFVNPLFKQAVAAIDTGNVAALTELLILHPQLINEQANFPGGGYFETPYLIYFVAGNPIRNETIPATILDIMQVLIKNVNQHGIYKQHQLDYTLDLIGSGRIPKESGKQIAMMDLLIDAGASPGNGAAALTHGNINAARHLLKRGGKYTLVAAACFNETEKVEELIKNSNAGELLTALAAAAFYGKSEMISLLLSNGALPDGYPVSEFHTHATPLHQAVYSGNLECVKLLVVAGADLLATDKIYYGTPLDWARHLQTVVKDENGKERFKQIEEYLLRV